MSWNEYGTEQDIYDDGYNRGRLDGYEEGMKRLRPQTCPDHGAVRGDGEDAGRV